MTTTFEESLGRLEAIVRELEGGRLTLDESLARFEEGVRLARECRERLAAVEDRLKELLADGSEASVVLTPR